MRSIPFSILLAFWLLSSCQSNQNSQSVNDPVAKEDLAQKPQDEIQNSEKESNNEAKKPNRFPPLQDLANLENTKFIPVLESKISTKENGFYTAALPLAWDTLEFHIPDSVLTLESLVMQEVDRSTSYQTALGKGRFKTDVVIEENRISVRVSFQKTLPFEEPFDKLKAPLLFKGIPVTGYGGRGYGAVRDNTTILYYNNDEDFAIKLKSRIRHQEIYLVKSGFPARSSLKEMVDGMAEKVEQFQKKVGPANRWRSQVLREDELQIPILKFHVESHIPEIEGSLIHTASGDTLYFETAYQKTGFIMDERGAEVESLVELAEATGAMREDEEKPKPKRLIFDQPFFVMLRRFQEPYPYFALFVADAELMEEFEE